jgi:formate C-acetyltransferase
MMKRYILKTPPVKPCAERAELFTESFKQTEGLPLVIRRAKALENVLANMTIYIKEGELVVGNAASAEGLAPYFPEMNQHVARDYWNRLTEDERGKIDQIVAYWNGRSVYDKVMAELPEVVKKHVVKNKRVLMGHLSCIDNESPMILNFKPVLERGLEEIAEEAKRKLQQVESVGASEPRYLDKKHFYEAAIIACNAVVNFARRYALLARKMAQEESNTSRKEELLNIANVCDRIPKSPAVTFQEALQAFWFVLLVAKYIEASGRMIGARFDQLFYPCFRNSADKYAMTKEQALELIECLWIKIGETRKLQAKSAKKLFEEATQLQQVIIGGTTKEGDDAANELTYLAIDATRNLHCALPDLKLRYHPKTSDEVILKALETIKTGLGKPSFHNDLAYFNNEYLAHECEGDWERIKDHVFGGCTTPRTPTKPHFGTRYATDICVLKCLELALSNGTDLQTGETIGIQTGNPAEFSSVEEIITAYRKQLRHFLKIGVNAENIATLVATKELPRPFKSVLYEDCMANGIDCIEWSTRRMRPLAIEVGLVNVVDSLAAIKKLVFEDGTVAMQELLDALKHNFEQKERLRQMLINMAPKLGNDEDYVDDIGRHLFKLYADDVNHFTTPYGNAYVPSAISVTKYLAYGKLCGASPDGRKSGEPLADAGISPMLGRDVEGPTAVLKSASKIATTNYRYSGHLFNQRLNPMTVETEEGERKFVNYIRTWGDLGIQHIQFNCINSKVLRDAQKHPQKHSDLIIRVAGYCAYFVRLSKELQDSIIKRTEQIL